MQGLGSFILLASFLQLTENYITNRLQNGRLSFPFGQDFTVRKFTEAFYLLFLRDTEP